VVRVTAVTLPLHATSFVLSVCLGSTKVLEDNNNRFHGQLHETIGLLRDHIGQEPSFLRSGCIGSYENF
jgi:hypothetical protein